MSINGAINANGGHHGARKRKLERTRIGVVGCGYWGPNLIRNFHAIPEVEMAVCCDADTERLQRMQTLYPTVEVTTDIEEVLCADVDAVAIATPVSTHYPLAKHCLEAGKHVMIEKPMTGSVTEAEALIQTAEEHNRVLMVGHTFEYTASVNKIKEIIDSGELGEILYVSSTRVNLGLFQKDINVVWDLAPHDISIILYVLGQEPVAVNAQGSAHFREGIQDVASTTLTFDGDTIAFLHHSWLDPNKIRKMVFVGSKKMLVYDDINPNEKLKIFDKGVDVPNYYDSFAEFHYSYRYGDIYIPRVEEYEPLRRECSHFVDCVREGESPVSDGHSGLRVIRILEGATKSMEKDGAAVRLTELVAK